MVSIVKITTIAVVVVIVAVLTAALRERKHLSGIESKRITTDTKEIQMSIADSFAFVIDFVAARST